MVNAGITAVIMPFKKKNGEHMTGENYIEDEAICGTIEAVTGATRAAVGAVSVPASSANQEGANGKFDATTTEMNKYIT